MKSLRWIVAFWLGVSAVFAASWKEGDSVEALSYGKWYRAKIIGVEETRWKVTYDGYSSGSDEWLPAEKIRALRKGSWKTGDRVQALSYGKWYAAKIIEAEVTRWKVTYDGYSSASDEWVDVDRLRAEGAKGSGATDPTGKAVNVYKFPARPDGAAAGIEGAFLRVESFYWNGRLSLTNQAWFFTKNGRFIQSPTGGMDLKAFAEAEDAGKTGGSYWVEGDKLTLAWADGSKATVYSFTKDGDGYLLDELGTVRVKGFKRGWRFDGAYEGGASITGGSGGTSIATSNTVVFRKDGTFARSSIGTFSSKGDSTEISGGGQSEGAGTYEFDGYSLTLKPKDGAETCYTVFAFGGEDDEGRPFYIYREGTMMKRQ